MESRASPSLPFTIALPAGGELVVRRLRIDDLDGIVALYTGLSSTDRHRRFFSQFPARREWVAAWIDRCLDSGDGVVAAAPEGRLVGEASYVPIANGNGEFALTVDSDWRGWLGPFLLDVLVDVAAANGVPNLEADILTENTPMRAIVRQRNAVATGDGDFTVQHVVIGTTGRQATWPPRTITGDGRPRVLLEAGAGSSDAAAAATRAGFAVLRCGGPDTRAGVECPMRRGLACPLASDADAIVIAMPKDDALTAWLAEAHGRLHPDVPVLEIRSAADMPPQGAELAGTCRLAAGAPSAVLIDALDRLVGNRVRRR